ncbi:MAG TPA: hypothetical protein PL072_05460 [Phycisphaerales bacterium]|mgnify:CR=1 FL=1|nr:hypothetical protein [Phycisphaerales bacterium]
MTNPYFKASSSAKPHLVRGPGGLKGEIWKLRQELEAAFATIGGTERRVSDPERFVVKTRPTPA